MHYFVFDTLRDGSDITAAPLSERRTYTERIISDAGDVFVLPPVLDDVDDALAASAELALEGVVVKDPASAYRAGMRTEDWLKVKLTRTQEVVIGGVRPGKGNREGSIGSLLVGIPADDGLRYAGRVGTGFSDRDLARLLERLTPLGSAQSPFASVPKEIATDAIWVQAELVAEIEFAEWSPKGHVRHARWRGLRPDKRPEDVRAEN